MARWFNTVIVVLLGGLLTACATSPTGRSQFIYMPDNQVNQMGLQAFDQLKAKKPHSKNQRYIRFVNCIAEAITQETGGNWEVVVFKDKTLNAFALPGNKIGVHTGLIELVDNQAQLAAVIGHEVGHVLARHSNERMSEKTALNQGIALVAAISQPTSVLGKLGLSALGIGAEYGVILPFSRTHESEADVIGLELMAKAGFDPKQSIVLWQKMDQASQGRQAVAEFLSTHPSHHTRIKDLSAAMPKALKYYQNAVAIGKKPHCQK